MTCNDEDKIDEMLASIQLALNIITTVAYKCCADHSLVMTSSLVTALANGSHISLMTAPAE